MLFKIVAWIDDVKGVFLCLSGTDFGFNTEYHRVFSQCNTEFFCKPVKVSV